MSLETFDIKRRKRARQVPMLRRYLNVLEGTETFVAVFVASGLRL